MYLYIFIHEYLSWLQFQKYAKPQSTASIYTYGHLHTPIHIHAENTDVSMINSWNVSSNFLTTRKLSYSVSSHHNSSLEWPSPSMEEMRQTQWGQMRGMKCCWEDAWPSTKHYHNSMSEPAVHHPHHLCPLIQAKLRGKSILQNQLICSHSHLLQQ